MDFHDYIINYPSQDDEDIQYKTSHRQEFYELRGSPFEDVPKKGEFFKHQELFTRYLTQYDRIFNIHETGTGKTGSILDAAETFRKEYIGINRVIVIEPGKPTLEDFKSQIVKFFPDEYDDKYNKSDSNRKRVITKKIDKWYTLETYEAFSNKISKMSLEEMEKVFSNTMFFLDEAHRMRNYGDSDKEDENIYNNLWKLLHVAKRTKIVIGTATPLVNSVNDFVPLLNLLLPADYQMPIKNWDYSNVTLEQLEPFMRGKMSFVRSIDTGVNIQYKGLKIKYNHIYNKPIYTSDDVIPYITKIIDRDGNIVDNDEPVQVKNKFNSVTFKSDMNLTLLPSSTFQKKVMINASKSKQSFELSSRESSVFVYPDNTWGNQGFNNYIRQDDGIYKFKNDDIKNFLTVNNKLSIDKLSELSSKFGFYVNKELKASETNKPGNSFCYIEFVSGSGAILLGLILELFGFVNFTRKSSVFNNDKGNRVMQKSFKPNKRFALITSKTENLDKIIELFNSKENMDGQYLQIIIASKIARDGINLANVLRGYILSPGWHESGMYQALSRFIRATSHKMLLDLKRDVKIDIFKLATCTDIEPFRKDIKINNIKKLSIDVFNYMKSEEKDLYNRIVLRHMKNVAFDAVLNYQRNHRSTDLENTKQTDYGEVFPPVWSGETEVNPSELVTNTKKLIYYKEIINKLDNLIKTNLFNNKLITIDSLINFGINNGIEKYYVYYYIDTRLFKLNIYDSFGNKRKILMKGKVLYLDNTEHHYTSNALNILPLVKNTNVENLDSFYNKIKDLTKNEMDKYIRNYIWKLNVKNKPIVADIVPNQKNIIKILEDYIVSIRNGSNDPVKLRFYELFIHYINKADYPTDKIEEVKQAYQTKSGKAGRTPKKYSSSKLVGLKFPKMDTGKDTVYYHFFNVVTETNNIVNIFRREDNKVRILKHNSNEFVDANIEELPIFQNYYKQDIAIWMSKYYQPMEDGSLYYGTVNRDSKFRIITAPFDTSKGTVCGTNKEDSTKLLSRINLNTENLDMLRRIMDKHKILIDNISEISKEDMEKDLSKRFDNINVLRQNYFWNKVAINSSSKELCDYLKKYMEIKNKLIYTL